MNGLYEKTYLGLLIVAMIKTKYAKTHKLLF